MSDRGLDNADTLSYGVTLNIPISKVEETNLLNFMLINEIFSKNKTNNIIPGKPWH